MNRILISVRLSSPSEFRSLFELSISDRIVTRRQPSWASAGRRLCLVQDQEDAWAGQCGTLVHRGGVSRSQPEIDSSFPGRRCRSRTSPSSSGFCLIILSAVYTQFSQRADAWCSLAICRFKAHRATGWCSPRGILFYMRVCMGQQST